MLKLLFSVLGIAGLVYLALCGWLSLGQRRLMFLPTQSIETTPGALGIDYEEVFIPVGANPEGQISAWWLPASDSAGLTFLYLHGNAGNMSNNLDRVLLLRSLGASVLTIDYRGYGFSSGPFPTEQQLYEDALTAVQFLQQEKGVSLQHLVLYGHSLGGAIGIEVANQVPQLAGLVVEGSFTSMGDMAALSHYNGWFPVRRLLTQRFDSLAKVGELTMPVLYLHGLADASVPSTMSHQLYQATPDPKDLWLVPNADHNDLIDWAGAEFAQRLQQFLDHHVLVNP
jgi:uncharacterized protein